MNFMLKMMKRAHETRKDPFEEAQAKMQNKKGDAKTIMVLRLKQPNRTSS